MDYTTQAGPTRFLSDFWTEKYLREYIPLGGSKIKFVTGRVGSGKTFFLRLMRGIAERENFQTVSFSAKNVWLHDFKEIYAEIYSQCDIMDCLGRCARKIIENTGFSPDDIPEGFSFVDHLAQIDMNDALTKREIRSQLRSFFLDNPVLDNNFALACSMITGGILGHPVLENQNRELLLGWLRGDKTVKLSLLRALGLSPSRITKYNARNMLRSLSEIVKLSGMSGMFITIDDLETLLVRSSMEELHYTKIKREDTYESIRQMVDDIDTMTNIMFVFAFDRAMIDDEKSGFKSYQALWMRIQSEVTGQRFNRFADIVDLDLLAAQEYDVQALLEISRGIAEQENMLKAIVAEQAEGILAQAKTGAVGIPGLVRQAMLGGSDNV